MLHTALHFLADSLTEGLSTGTIADRVDVGSVTDESGGLAFAPPATRIALLNIEMDHRAIAPPVRPTSPEQDRRPPLPIIATILIAARMSDYAASLRRISQIVAFLDARPSFHSEQWPRLPVMLSPLTLQFQSMDLERLSLVWRMLRVPPLPSALYQVRLPDIRAEARIDRSEQ